MVLDISIGELDLKRLVVGDRLECTEGAGTFVLHETDIGAIGVTGVPEALAARAREIKGICGRCSKECPFYKL